MTTANKIAYDKLQEDKRANKKREAQTSRDLDLKKRDQNIKIAGLVGKAIGKAGSIAGSIIGEENDPSWYNLDKQLVKDVASISFGTPLGQKFIGEVGNSDNRTSVPGILGITFMPSVGLSNDSGSGSVCDVAAKNVYAYVRHANSGSRNYEAADLMQYILGIDNAGSYWASLRRLYSVLLTSKSHNKYYLKKFVQTLGYDYDDLITHIADLRSYVNAFAIKLNSFYIPADMPIIKRHLWMNSNIFKDSSIKKSSEYVFIQQRFLHYEDTLGTLQSFFPEDVSGVNNIDFYPNAGITFDQIKLLGNKIIDKFIESEDAGIMSGDILKAYGESSLIYFESTPEDFHIESVYSPEVLSQITNLNLCDASTATDAFDIKQDSEGHVYQGVKIYNYDDDKDLGYGILADFGDSDQTTTEANQLNGYNYLINMYKDDVSPDDIMVATRLKCGLTRNVKLNTGSTTAVRRTAITSCGTEICIKAYMQFIDEGSEYKYATINIMPDCLTFRYSMQIVNFDWAPAMYFFANDSEEYAYLFRNQDLANYAIISKQNLDNMHYVAVLSELGVPNLGMKVRTR